MLVVNCRPKISQQRNSQADYLFEIFPKIFKGTLSFESHSSGANFTKIECHNYAFQT